MRILESNGRTERWHLGHGIAAPIVALGMLALTVGGCRETYRSEAHAASEASLASASSGVPLDARPNRAGVPTSGSVKTLDKGASGSGAQAKKSDKKKGKDKVKDYWASIPFDRTNFEEVRNFVHERYLDPHPDIARAYADAASFALASDSKDQLLLLPETFYKARKDNPDEKGLLKGKMLKLDPSDTFVIVEVSKKKVKDKNDDKKLTDDEIRALRNKDMARTRQLDHDWDVVHFSASDFNRVMAFAAKKLGKDPKWSMKKAWVVAAQGYLYSLDPHSSIIAKKAWQASTKELTDSSFEGIGALLTQRPGSDYTIVESPIEGQPAVKAGLRAGDVIIKVDGNGIKGELLPEVVSQIRGKRGTTVSLTIEREGNPKPINIAIVRERIVIKNIQAHMVAHHKDIGYIKITGFVPTTNEALGKAYDTLIGQTKSGHLRGLVLDLRNNSGGLLRQGIAVANRFVSKGIIVSVKNRDRDDEVYRANAPGTWSMPLVVLTNDGTASAAEIVASAIQDNHRGLIVGDRTFGKASVQTLYSPLLRDDYYIKLTVARYYSPSGRTLQVIGVRPDVPTPPDVGGKMPLGFREVNLSHHLPPLNSNYTSVNKAWAAQMVQCANAHGIAVSLYKKHPNPAVKYDYQLMRGADLLECMASHPGAAKAPALAH